MNQIELTKPFMNDQNLLASIQKPFFAFLKGPLSQGNSFALKFVSILLWHFKKELGRQRESWLLYYIFNEPINPLVAVKA